MAINFSPVNMWSKKLSGIDFAQKNKPRKYRKLKFNKLQKNKRMGRISGAHHHLNAKDNLFSLLGFIGRLIPTEYVIFYLMALLITTFEYNSKIKNMSLCLPTEKIDAQ
ncbi:MAG: hypothetical protein Q3M24_18275 [Candidatus Electrothrix aestuarii]|uniref:Uncharacterized protein n=1 Tax=Candidatus Electrothrix aestuarii TaxID=3062594 RepID=A0AAU8LSE2_9BACT